MNWKDHIFTLSIALLGVWLLQNFFWSNKTQDLSAPGTEFVAPTTKSEVKPLNYEVDFNDSQKAIDLNITNIDTDYASMSFSNHGGVLDSIVYKDIFTDKSLQLNTLQDNSEIKSKAFLVALNGIGATPFYYNLIEHKKLDSATKLVYESKTNKYDIIKEFIVYDKKFKIDLNLTVKPNQQLSEDKYIEPRIFYPSPKLPNVEKQDIVQAIIYTDQQALIKKPIDAVAGKGWISPSLFGTEDRYFVNSLVNSNNFVKRAYFEQLGPERLVSILEGPQVKEAQTWNLEFYFGPKKSESLLAVDAKLESVMEYGWLWFISKPMLYILNWLYEFIGNYGWAIVILAILIKLIMLPFTWKFNPDKMKKQQEELNKKMRYIEQKYRHDKEALMREKMELIKKYGMFGGALGMFGQLFLQVPMLVALRRVLQNNLEFYDAPFLWIKDLSDYDPYYILPTLFGVGMAFSMLSGSKFDPRKSVFQVVLVLVMTVFMSKVSSGLMLYLIVGVFAQVVQSYLQKAFK